jgi:hypothetical protein
MKQKQHEGDPNAPAPKPGQVQDNTDAINAAAKGKDMLKRLEQAAKPKRGRYVDCCGVRVWVED